MPKRISSSMEVLLGLLTIESMSGYDLGQLIRSSIHHFWNESYGQIYPNLKKLAAQDLITGKTEKQKGKPDRQIYSITKKGRQRLGHWLEIPPQPEVPRNELLLKIFFGSKASVATIQRYVERMAENERAVLERFELIGREIAANPQYPDAPYWRMVLRFGQIELEAHLQWAEETLTSLRNLSPKPDLKPSPAAQWGSAGSITAQIESCTAWITTRSWRNRINGRPPRRSRHGDGSSVFCLIGAGVVALGFLAQHAATGARALPRKANSRATARPFASISAQSLWIGRCSTIAGPRCITSVGE